MTTDARNSIILWVSVIAFFGLFWAALHFNVLSGVSHTTWIMKTLAITSILNVVLLCYGVWRRRAANPHNPNRVEGS